MWMIPLAVTIVATGLLGWFLYAAEGEDIMAAPIFFMAWFIAVFGAWGIYGVWHFISWLF
jgi:hypothetical protein